MKPSRAWETSLGAIEVAVGDCLKALERYEASFQKAYTEQGGPGEALQLHAAHDALDETWTRQLAGADRSAEDVEQLLAEQEIVWTRWQELVAGWKHSLEQTPELNPEHAHAHLRRDPPRSRAI